MNGRRVLRRMAGIGLMAALALSAPSGFSGTSSPEAGQGADRGSRPAPGAPPLKAPDRGSIPVAFLLSEGAVIIDFAGPWEVFQDANVQGRSDPPFRLYTVAETTAPIRASGGMKIVPDYTLQTAPPPEVIVIPAQGTRSKPVLEWIRKSAKGADVTLSVCTGAFLLARTGLLSGRSATTHHSGYRELEADFPDIRVIRGARFVEDGGLATAGGLTSGIDLALRVVERYFGREAAAKTAYDMEYQGQGWMNPDSNRIYAGERVSTERHPLCPVCEMEVDPASAPVWQSAYKGTTYYFCSRDHKERFDEAPGRFVAATGIK